MTLQLYLSFGSEIVYLHNPNSTYVAEDFRVAYITGEDTAVVEDIDILITSTKDYIEGWTRSVGRLLETARRQSRLQAAKEFVFINFALSEDDTVYRSRVMDGDLKLLSGFVHPTLNGQFQCKLLVEHRPYWEGPWTDVYITNDNEATPTASTWGCYPVGDGVSTPKQINWAKVAADDIEGDMPGPIELHQTRNNDGLVWGNRFLGIFVDYHDTGKPVINTEIEDWTAVAAGSNQVNANASGQYYFDVTAMPSSWSDIAYMSLGTAPITNARTWRGIHYRVNLRLYNRPIEGSWYKLYIYDTGSQLNIWEGVPVQVNDVTTLYPASGECNIDLGSVKLPPMDQWPPYVVKDLRLYLAAYVSGGGGHVYFDSMQFVPTDFFALLEMPQPHALGMPEYSFEEYVDSWGEEPVSYVQETGDLNISTIRRSGSGLFLVPGKDNYFVCTVGNKWIGTATATIVAGRFNTQMFYRPRRRNL